MVGTTQEDAYAEPGLPFIYDGDGVRLEFLKRGSIDRRERLWRRERTSECVSVWLAVAGSLSGLPDLKGFDRPWHPETFEPCADELVVRQ